MLQKLLKIKYVVLAGGLLTAGFAWAGMYGARLLGDDLESVEKMDNNSYQHGSGRRSGHRTGFYHK